MTLLLIFLIFYTAGRQTRTREKSPRARGGLGGVQEQKQKKTKITKGRGAPANRKIVRRAVSLLGAKKHDKSDNAALAPRDGERPNEAIFCKILIFHKNIPSNPSAVSSTN